MSEEKQASPEAPPPTPMDIPTPLVAKQSFMNKLMTPPLVFIVIAVIAMASAGGTILFLGQHKGNVVDAGESLAGEAQAGEAQAAEEKKPEEKKEEKKDAPKVEGEEKKAEGAQGSESPDGIMVKLEPQVYNVMEKNSIHYLKLKMAALVSTAEAGDELKANDEQIRDKILYLISDSSIRDLMSTGGKTLLKEDIINSMNKVLKKGTVKQVYFTEFTIQ
ncbi:MAG: flagellar basal body-associated FliL family protein [Deltaproteobacteria bacterium]|nr:MAG: flagellar basal body-associated FliL family protein [Deltaproteobacteria bacterium]